MGPRAALLGALLLAACGGGSATGSDRDGGPDGAARDGGRADGATVDGAAGPDGGGADGGADAGRVDGGPGAATPWVTAYYAGWMHDRLPPSEVDWGAMSHVVHFSVMPRADGTLRLDVNGTFQDDAWVARTVEAAHAGGVKVLIAIGGWYSRDVFEPAMSAANRATFVASIVDFVERHGYDGVDLDMEDMVPENRADFQAFVRDLRAALDALDRPRLITAAISWQPGIFAGLVAELDQINLMTYDMAGPYPGWVVWHNAPLHDGGRTFPSTGAPLPSADGRVEEMLDLGVPIEKLGIGLDFYGYVWHGHTAPGETWTTAPTIDANVPYHRIVSDWYDPAAWRWDDGAGAAYLTFDRAGTASDAFVSYDDETTAAAKIDYVRARGLGGLIIWELGGGYLEAGADPRHPLLSAVKAAAFGE